MIGFLFLILVFSLPARAADAPAALIRITVYHTNDIHGWIMPRDHKAADGSTERVGGAAALAAAVRRDSGPKLLLDAGDWFQGTPEGTLSKGQAVVDVFNALDYDAVEVGNHDFDLGQDRLRELAAAMKPPVLGANVYDVKTKTRVPYLKPHILREVAGVKIGIFGLLTTHMPQLEFAKKIEGLSFRREIDEAADQVQELKAQGATVIIAVTHVGWEDPKAPPFEGDQYLAGHVPGIDLIIGGHSHTLLAKPGRDAANGTLIVQTGSYLTHVGKTTLEIDPITKRVAHSDDEVVELHPGAEDARDVAGAVSKYQEEIGRALEVVVGTAADTLTRNREGESSLGDWMADCSREWAGTDTAFQNGGGIRSDLPAGPVTLHELFEVMPFDNYVVKFKLSGKDIRKNLEQGVSGTPGVIQISGIRFAYDPKQPVGHRVVSATIDGRPIEDSRVYTSATIDFVFKGGDGYDFSKAAEPVETGTLMRDVLAWCARRDSPIRASVPGRIAKD